MKINGLLNIDNFRQTYRNILVLFLNKLNGNSFMIPIHLPHFQAVIILKTHPNNHVITVDSTNK